MPKIGAHVSAAISLELSFKKAQEIGAECTQIFISPPQQWMMPKHGEEVIARYRAKAGESGIGPNFIHGTYLINLGASSPEHLQKSIDWLIWGMNLAEKLGVEGIIFHTGSHKGAGFDEVKNQVVKALSIILGTTRQLAGRTPESTHPHPPLGWSPSNPLPEGEEDQGKKPYLILEISAGAGGSIGGTFQELGKILKEVNDPRLKVCIDTQHAFGAGYDVKSLIGLNDVLEEFDQEIGLENLAAIHANDSKVEYKSGRDRHENIGVGFIGREGFENMLNHPKLKDVPFILEVPGFTGSGPDAENIQTLKSLRAI